MLRALLVAAATAALLYLLYAAALFGLQDRLLFPGTLLPVPPNLPSTRDAQLIKLSAGDVRSVAFYLPAIAPGPDGKTGALILAHGNGEIADYLVDPFSGWRSMGVALLIVEYPGYGRAPGSPGEDSIRKTMSAAFDWLAARPEIDAGRIAAHGVSLGGGAVGLLLRDRPLAAAILHATFTSLRAFPADYGLPSFLLRTEMNTLDAVERSKVPILVVHGRLDNVIPPSHGERLAKAARMTDFSLWECGHGCFHDFGRPLLARQQLFLQQHGVIAPR